MAVRVRRRADLPCDMCRATAAAAASVVTVEQGGVMNALCRKHAAMMLGEPRLEKLMRKPAKRTRTMYPLTPPPSA